MILMKRSGNNFRNGRKINRNQAEGMRMKYVMSDIHGDFKYFYKMLVKINFSLYDKLYILGDILDKGTENLCLYDYIRHAPNIFLIKGNHEFLCERFLEGKISAELWDACGGRNTRCEVEAAGEEERNSLTCYLKELPVYIILKIKGEEYFLTHSGYHADFCIPAGQSGLVDIAASVRKAVEMDQERYLFSNDIHYIPCQLQFDKKIIVGHYPTLFLDGHNRAEIYHGVRYIDIDTGNERRSSGGRLSCLRLDDWEEYYV